MYNLSYNNCMIDLKKKKAILNYPLSLFRNECEMYFDAGDEHTAITVPGKSATAKSRNVTVDGARRAYVGLSGQFYTRVNR